MVDTGKAILIIGIIAIIAAIWIISASFRMDQKYIEAGYTRTTLPGAYGAYWVKPEVK